MSDPKLCAWCHDPMPAKLRRDAVCCSKRCRQARHRFMSAVGASSLVATGHPRRIAYADPPYPGKSARYYGQHVDFAGEVDHAELVASLSADYDAWALSTSAEALQSVLAVCPTGVRVAAWFRGHRYNKLAKLPLNAWEPVIYAGQIIRRGTPAPHDASHDRDTTRRPDPLDASPADPPVAQDLHDASRPPGERDATVEEDASRVDARRVDALIYRPGSRTTDPDRVVGAKPATFCRWLFELLDAQPGDEFVDVFPGSGGVARAWDIWTDVERDASLGDLATDLDPAAEERRLGFAGLDDLVEGWPS